MSVRGRKPTPTHLRLIRGDKGKAASKSREPKPVGALRHCPEWFSIPQKAAWAYAIEHAPAGLLRMLDRDALAVWVVAQDLWRQAVQAQEKIDAGKALPLLTKTPNGMAQQSPYVGIISKQSQIMLKASAELGFTPSSRSRIQVDPEDDQETLEGILGAR